MDESKKEYLYKKKKEYMDKKNKEYYGENKREDMKGTNKAQRMMGFKRAGESRVSLGYRRVEPCHAHHHGDDRSERWHTDHCRDHDQITDYGIQHQDMRLRPHRHHDHSRRSIRSILNEKHDLERLVYALQRRLQKVDCQLKNRMEHRFGHAVADPRRGASRF